MGIGSAMREILVYKRSHGFESRLTPLDAPPRAGRLRSQPFGGRRVQANRPRLRGGAGPENGSGSGSGSPLRSAATNRSSTVGTKARSSSGIDEISTPT